MRKAASYGTTCHNLQKDSLFGNLPADVPEERFDTLVVSR